MGVDTGESLVVQGKGGGRSSAREERSRSVRRAMCARLGSLTATSKRRPFPAPLLPDCRTHSIIAPARTTLNTIGQLPGSDGAPQTVKYKH